MPLVGFCEICNKGCHTERGHAGIQIFNSKHSTAKSGKPLASIVSQLVDRPVTEDVTKAQIVCNSCHRLCTEVDDLQNRVSQIKSNVLNNSLNASKSDDNTDERSEPERPKKTYSKNEIPKKILDIPSSDDESAAAVPDEKSNFQIMEDIEMELVKMHGGPMVENEEEEEEEGEERETETLEMVLEDDEQFREMAPSAASDIVDSGAIEHSSDSDYEPDGNHIEGVERHFMVTTEEGINIKLEPITDETPVSVIEKPNILKKKTISIMNGSIEMNENKMDSLSQEIPLVSREGNIYTCLLCDGDEIAQGEAKPIISHMKSEHAQRLYICDVCGEDFRKRNELSHHLDDHVATEEGDFQCEVCNRIFNNLRLFRIHRRMHYPQNKSWICDTCGRKYSSKNLLDEHVNSHLGVRPYVCETCGKDFASKYTYKAHEKTHEVRPRPYNCPQCPKSFLSQQNLSQHEKTHNGVKEYGCHLCGKHFGSAHNLEVHSIVHTGYKPFVCGLCGKSFARKAEIRDHERTHTGERPYQCEMCGATFSQRSNLQSHKRATHYDDKRYRCDNCGKGFKRRRLLDYHVKAAHTGERPFKCDVCEATFVYPEHFKKHRRIHTGEKPFHCEVCGKAFNSRDNRNAHRFVHSDKKPYECLVCGAGFMRKPLLYQHMQTQGHLNDTIVVNQPRLTTDDDQVVTVNAAGEMEIVDASSASVASDSKLYIADADGNEHIIIDGDQINFAHAGSDDDELESHGEIVDEIEQVVIQDDEEEEDYAELITSEAIASGETQIIDTPEGPIQLVKVRIPNENGEEEETWIKIVPE